jgi:hypothetical protein
MGKIEIKITRDESEIHLGERYEDTITGFAGIAVSRHEYLYGCTRVTLQKLHDGSVRSETFDAPALKGAGAQTRDG